MYNNRGRNAIPIAAFTRISAIDTIVTAVLVYDFHIGKDAQCHITLFLYKSDTESFHYIILADTFLSFYLYKLVKCQTNTCQTCRNYSRILHTESSSNYRKIAAFIITRASVHL